MAFRKLHIYYLSIITAWSAGTVILPRIFVLSPYVPTVDRLHRTEASSNESESVIDPSRRIVPLQLLTGSAKTIECREGLVPVYDSLDDPSLTFQNRKIPRIVHLTFKSRCLHPDLAENVESWRFPDHSFFFHDDEAMDKLLYRDWPEFPQLKYAIKCLLYGGAAKADIWRILVLWEYGGIYADIDSSPNLDKFNGTTIAPDDDAYFVIEVMGTASQWFMAASPRHPMMYFTLHEIMAKLMALEDVGNIPIVWTTGPGAVADGFRKFLGPNKGRWGKKPPAGVYVGPDGRTVTLVGSSNDENEYITRNIYESVERLRSPGKNFNQAKHKAYESMEMAHLTTFGYRNQKNLRNESCAWRMWRAEMEKALYWKPTW